jgi:phosphoribosylaminoimidazolecarboxamide formyltransferase/IMP cyclohydrolase
MKEILVQSEDIENINIKDFQSCFKKKPNTKQMKNLLFAFKVCRYVKSNAIVLVSNETTTGIGSGQPSRLDSCKIAIDKMKKVCRY